MKQQNNLRLGAGAILTAALFLGREAFIWLWGKILDATSGLFTGETPKVTVPTPFPWLDALGLILAVVGSFFLALSFRRSPQQTIRPNLDSELSVSPQSNEELQIVYKQVFRNAEIRLDGKKYLECKFHNVSIVYNGGPASLEGNLIDGIVFKTDKQEIQNYARLLFELGMLKIPAFGPDGPVKASTTWAESFEETQKSK